MSRSEIRREEPAFPPISKLRLPTHANSDSSSLPTQPVAFDNQAPLFKFLAQPNAPDVRNLRDAAVTVFMLLEPWNQAKKCFSDRHVLDLIDRVICQASAYRSSIAESVQTAEDGHAFAKDALGLCNSLVEGRRSARTLLTFVDSMQVIAKRSQEAAVRTQKKFNDTRGALMAIMAHVPAVASAMGTRGSSKKIVSIPVYLSPVNWFGKSKQRMEKKSLLEIQQELERAQQLLEQAVIHVSHFVNWWRSVQADLRALKEAIPTIAVDGSNPIRTEMTRDQWLEILQQYRTYSDEMLLLDQYFPVHVGSPPGPNRMLRLLRMG